MEKMLKEKEIRDWLLKNNPLGLFESKEDITIKDIDPKPWSGHFNFLVSSGEQSLVLRFKGPEWGMPDGVSGEYAILQKVEPFAVGPKVFFHTNDFFGEPMVLMEYLSGVLVGELPAEDRAEDFWQSVTRFIVRINEIPFTKDSFPFREPMTDYEKHKKAWTERTREIVECPETKQYGEEIAQVLPALFARLDDFTPLLQTVVQKHDPSFLFESAHAGHLMKVSDGFRFLNWEQVSYGDPSFMLAVFLLSIRGEKDVSQIREIMISEYLSERPIGDFEVLLERRLWERGVSNAIYSLWTAVRQSSLKKEYVINQESAAETVRAVKKLLQHTPQ